MFGNTEKVAAAVARGLQLEGVDTGLVEVHAAPASLSPDLDLLVVGGPTHGFSMSRASTRADAVRQGAPLSARLSGCVSGSGTSISTRPGCRRSPRSTRG